MAETLDEWAVIELYGHKRIAGHVTEMQIAGQGFVRVDVPGTDGDTTHLYGAAAIYGIHPTTETIARHVAKGCRAEPVQRWELPAAVPVDVEDDDGELEDAAAQDHDWGTT